MVAVSPHAGNDEPARAREAGADVCLTKPCVPSQVARAISALLHVAPPPNRAITAVSGSRFTVSGSQSAVRG